MKWFVVVLIMGGLFYAATRLMPSSSAIDVVWMARQIRVGMTKDEVRDELGGTPNSVMKGGIGKQETWYFQDRYKDDRQLVVEFIDDRVYRSMIDPPMNMR